MVVACWWLAPWKQLAPQWQAVTVRGQQHLMKIADAIQKTTCEHMDGAYSVDTDRSIDWLRLFAWIDI